MIHHGTKNVKCQPNEETLSEHASVNCEPRRVVVKTTVLNLRNHVRVSLSHFGEGRLGRRFLYLNIPGQTVKLELLGRPPEN